MKILSLFDGMGGARVALHNLGVVPEIYATSEINSHAISVTDNRWGNFLKLGDITKIIDNRNLMRELGSHKWDLMIFGSPCTDLSVARKNRESLAGKNSGLFYRAIELWDALRPTHFLMENVASMSAESEQEISEILGEVPYLINSRYFTGQHRERLYWCNWTANDYKPQQPVWFRDKLLPFNELMREKEKLSISQAGKEYMLRKTADGRDHYAFGHHSNTDKPYSACVVANFKKGVPYNVLLDYRNHQAGPWIRRFHPVECERLQGFPDRYTEGLGFNRAWTPRYEMIGNSFTVPVIEYLLKPIIK